MPLLKRNDSTMCDVLTHTKTIAVVGHSDKSERTSYQIAQFLRSVGYTVYPVNPTVKEIDGQQSYSSLQEIPVAVDIVNVFRRSEYLSEIVDEAIAINAKTIWAQLGVADQQAAQKALDAGLNVVMDACIKVEYLRLGIG
ncbi:CoA-binding protein [Hapalosiphon sp. MRB220]|nr:CoA-binding protein [Hapalosiphon sp. MRB220]